MNRLFVVIDHRDSTLPSRARTEENSKKIRGRKMIQFRRSNTTLSGKIDSHIE